MKEMIVKCIIMNVAREYPEGMIATPLEFEKIMGDWIDVK